MEGGREDEKEDDEETLKGMERVFHPGRSCHQMPAGATPPRVVAPPRPASWPRKSGTVTGATGVGESRAMAG